MKYNRNCQTTHLINNIVVTTYFGVIYLYLHYLKKASNYMGEIIWKRLNYLLYNLKYIIYLMSKYAILKPRGSGKTTMALYEFIKDPINTLYVTYVEKDIYRILSDANDLFRYEENFISSNNVIDYLPRKSYTTIILDNYLSYQHKDKIYNKIQEIGWSELYVFSTLPESYDTNLLKFVTENKYSQSYSQLIKLFERSREQPISDKIKRNIYELYYNFLTDDDIAIIK